MAKITDKFRKYLALIGMSEREIVAPLAGIDELRKVVKWANGQPESDHDFRTPEDVIAAYRRATCYACDDVKHDGKTKRSHTCGKRAARQLIPVVQP